ncbi:hypothetical protein [Phyllobacterium endophyticum]|uniref:Uncharacterized protein n=1 Tax=Phyllobacterium endophyticum TaxID=1149773 RepID=A0A2P7AUT2_9HYPH|nr:hypothetical protein [Phyllobacterium endophyticum]MBB3234473.1 hypothetical protein [Phyllobacterium endophyticum]PSH57975.1 hypothetical protein CU100_09880 [Phyllobacterium endophyticum]TYR39506.1 hypothetical protein FY050_20665 [Phyllobacterium endophyticum]
MKIAALLAVASALVGAGCAATPRLADMAAEPAANPSFGTASVNYRSVLGSYQHREPVDPKNWRQLNEDLAPKGEDS